MKFVQLVQTEIRRHMIAECSYKWFLHHFKYAEKEMPQTCLGVFEKLPLEQDPFRRVSTL